MLIVIQPILDKIIQEASNAYPDECCGFLLGKEEDEIRKVTDMVSCKNIAATKHNRFLISANDYVNAERQADENKLNLVGIYHSHPNTTADPSSSDLKAALPYFSYLIVGIANDNKTSIKSWQLNEQLQFEEEIITKKKTFFNKDFIHGNHHYSYALA